MANGNKFVSTQLRLPSPILGAIGGHDYMQSKMKLKKIRIVDCANKTLPRVCLNLLIPKVGLSFSSHTKKVE